MTPIDRAIAAARAVAKSDAAKACAVFNKGTHGTWTKKDEELLRQGIVRTPKGDYRIRRDP